MDVEFLAQPDQRVGDLIDGVIIQHGVPREFVMVSAFASLPTVLRFKPKVAAVRAAGGDARMVLGVDLGGTSKEVLQEVAGWSIPITIVKNRMFGVTFHPKVYLLRWTGCAEIIVGSNNFTEGGFYRNYEVSSRIVFEFPGDTVAFAKGVSELERFLKPTGPTAFLLTPTYLASLLALPEIPSEAEARRTRGEGTAKPALNRSPVVFGYEAVRPAPPLPTELQKLLLAARENQQAIFKKAISRIKAKAKGAVPGDEIIPIPQKPPPLAQIDPTAFYMTLAASKGATNPTIPGEQRIPLAAIEMAADFWGWDDNYDRDVSPKSRVYRNWRPMWRIWATDDPTNVITKEVRMYFYENSSDFRFYSGDLVRLNPSFGDIVRISRIDEQDLVYECVLARKDTPEYAEWLPLLVNEVKAGNSERRFGFA
jgi:hypothetical protein